MTSTRGPSTTTATARGISTRAIMPPAAGLGAEFGRNGHVDAGVRANVDGIAAEHRPLFDRIHGLILAAYPEADLPGDDG